MRPLVNVPEEDRTTDIDIMHKKFGKNRAYGSGIRRYLRGQTDRQTDRQTTTQTDRLITILCNRFRGRSNNKHYSW